MILPEILMQTLPLLGAFLGIFVASVLKPKTAAGLKLILAFSGAFLLSITVFELLPEIFSDDKNSFLSGLLQGSFYKLF
jgi:zinc transporter ZupT